MHNGKQPSPGGWRSWRSLPRAEAILLVNAFVVSIGIGLYAAVSLIYLTRFAKVSAEQAGFAMSLAAALWLVLARAVGRFADRIGAREVMVAFGLANALLIFSLIFVHGLAGTAVVLCALVLAENGSAVSRGALLGHILDKDRRVHVSARNRSASNAGLAIGSALAGVALLLNTRASFVAILVGFAAILVLVSMLGLRLPRAPRVPPQPGRRTRIVGKRAFLSVSLLFGLVTIHDTVLVIGVPLWIANHTAAPKPLAAWALIINTVLIVLLQVRTARGADTIPGGRRAVITGTLAVAVSCLLLGAASIPTSAVAATAAVVVGVLVLTYGELRAAAGGWGLRYGLANRYEQGVYGGIFSMGQSLRTVVGPALVTYLTGQWLGYGWVALAVVFTALALLMAPMVDWADRSRAREPEEPVVAAA